MKKLISTTVLTAILISQLQAVPQILIDAIHGWAEPFNNMSEVSDPAELFPDYDFDYLVVSDIIIEEVLSSGYLQSYQDTVIFNVPEGQEVLYLRYVLEDTSNFQQPYFYIINPLGEYMATSCYGLAYVEEPMSGEWTIIYSAWDELDTWYEVGTGPHFYRSEVLDQYDLVLQMVDNTFMLFQGHLPELTEYEYTQLNTYFQNGGGCLLLRETDMTLVDKPIIHLTSSTDLTVQISLKFLGAPTFLEPPAQITDQDGYTRLSWNANLTAGEEYEILYEGRPPGGMNILSVQNQGEAVQIENHSGLNLEWVSAMVIMIY
ncbi:MAG: hypothetical protein L3J79_05840 [Candidatus Marinimicrobia bacterium]|nr:hypothetical protein [Candidatus Neomarinimicrobiota bacterium]